MSTSLHMYGAIETLLSRKLAWRIGRWLYLGARREMLNDPRTNGEYALQGWILKACVQAGDKDAVFFDVGANIGEWSLSLLRQLAAAPSMHTRIYAFEPAPSQWKTLTRRLERRNDAVEIHCLNEALSDTPGIGHLLVTGADTGTNSLLSGATHNANTVGVSIGTVDAVMQRDHIEHIALLKIDAEGHDPNVIRGARNTMMRRAIDVIQFEYNWRWLNFNHTMKSLFEIIEPTGYTFGRLSQDEIELYENWHPELDRFHETNFVLIAPRLKPFLPVARFRFDAYNVAMRLT